MDKTVFMSTIPHHSSSGRTYREESHLETMQFNIPISTMNSSRRSYESSSDTDSYIGDKGNDVHRTSKINSFTKEESLPEPLSPSESVMDIKASKQS